jgi:hypothetical protein
MKWEKVYVGAPVEGTPVDTMVRFPVPGGWLYMNMLSATMAFVPDKANEAGHPWMADMHRLATQQAVPKPYQQFDSTTQVLAKAVLRLLAAQGYGDPP